MINYYDRTFTSFEDLKPEDLDFQYFEGVLSFILNPKYWEVIDITKFNNIEKFVEYVVYYIDWTYYSEVLPKCSFNSDFTKIKIKPPPNTINKNDYEYL